MIPTKTKMWTKFFFWLECWCVSQNNKRHFFDNQRKKNTSKKKNFFVIFAPLLLQVSCTQVPKNTTLPFEIIFSSDFFRINAAKFWKRYRFQCFGFFENISLPSLKKESDNEKKMRNKSTFYNAVFLSECGGDAIWCCKMTIWRF